MALKSLTNWVKAFWFVAWYGLVVEDALDMLLIYFWLFSVSLNLLSSGIFPFAPFMSDEMSRDLRKFVTIQSGTPIPIIGSDTISTVGQLCRTLSRSSHGSTEFAPPILILSGKDKPPVFGDLAWHIVCYLTCNGLKTIPRVVVLGRFCAPDAFAYPKGGCSGQILPVG